jgi:predicted ATPase/class 3 adenylate cyclase/Tfp pilus assembly protein PilF
MSTGTKQNALPMSELRALLLTDVVDSTGLSQRIGDQEMARLWAVHDRAARDLLPAWRGREIDKTDGMLLLFEAAADAANYALAYQKALDALAPALKARADLHVGSVALRENSPTDVALGAKPLEVEGVAKAIASRIMSIAMGGQILLSSDARRWLNDGWLHVKSHGHWRVKGVDEPIELFEIRGSDGPFVPPPDAEKAYRVFRQGQLWLPVRDIRHSLPAERDAFVGRDEALARLAGCIDSGARLVSVLGLGGIGKTRMVTRYGWSWLGEFPGGVWFCDLASAQTIDGIVNAVAQGLDVPLGRDDPVAQLGRAIAGRGRCLVILDNFEQVARHAEPTLGRWLDCADEARFVVTTREVLGLTGEEVLALPPLAPAEARSLFMQRAEAAHPGLQPNAEDRAAIAPLTELLDGLPLAIELAAARVRVMPPRMLLRRMSERFKLLASKGGRRDRQSTLRAAFDWSWDLLAAAERAALAQLSVFDGGFTLEAAEAVLDLGADAGAPWIVDVVHALVDKSFVRRRNADRFDLLVSVQVYAAEHLQTEERYTGSGPPALTAARRRHIGWFAALGAKRATEGHCADLDNLMTACRHAEALGDAESAAGALEGAWAALNLRGPFEAGAELAERVCAMPGLTDRAAAHARATLADALVTCGRPGQAHALYQQAISAARAVADARCEAQIADRLGLLLEYEGKTDQARAQYDAAMRIATALGEPDLQCRAYNGLGGVAFAEGRMAEASSHYECALTLARATGDRRMQGNLLGNLGNVHTEAGRMDEAVARSEEALVLARETGHRVLESTTLCNLGMMYALLDRLIEADAALSAALAVARELGHVRLEGVVLCNLGIVSERQGRGDEARSRFEAAVRIARALGDPRFEGQFLGYLGLMHARQGAHAEARRCLDAGEVLLRAASDQFALGVLLTGRAEAHHVAGDALAAAASLASAEAIALDVGAGSASELGLALVRARKLVAPAKH